MSNASILPTLANPTSPGGSSGQFQYNNAGSFAGAAALTYATSGNLVTATAQAATDIPLTIKGAVAQSGRLLQILDSSGNAQLVVDSNYALATTSTSTAQQIQARSRTGMGGVGGDFTFEIKRDGTNNYGNGAFLKLTDNTVSAYVKLKSNSFTQNLMDLEIHNTNGLCYSAPSSGGNFYYNPVVNTTDISILQIPVQTMYPGGGSPSPQGLMRIKICPIAATSPTSVADIASQWIEGAPTQSTNMTITRRVASLIHTGDAAGYGQIIRAATSQTQNLSEWQDVSLNIMSYINAAAQIGVAASSTSHPSIRMPAGTAPTSPNSGDVWTDTTQKTFSTYQAGIKQPLVGTTFTATADATVANTVTETSVIGSGVGTLTLPANFFVAGKTVRVSLKGKIATTGTPTLQFKAYLGSTAVVDTTAVTLATITGTNMWAATFDITCRTTGATGTVISQGAVAYFTAVGSPNGIASPTTATTTINTTASQALEVKITWGTASSSNTITGTNATVTVMN